MSIKLTVGFSRNPRIGPLIDGTVKPENIDLNFVIVQGSELFYRNIKYDEFDVSEMSFSDTLITKERSDGSRWDWSTLPVFLSRVFLKFNLYVNTHSGIEHIRDLKGKKVGVGDFTQTFVLWMRSVFKELYDIEVSDIIWYNGRLRERSHSGALDFDKDIPSGVSLKWLSEDQTLDVMLDRGELDAALFGISTPHLRTGRTSTGFDRYVGISYDKPNIRRLLQGEVEDQVSEEYYQKTGVRLPANHTVIVQNRVLREHPWVALELFKAFQRAKEVAYERARQCVSAYLFSEGNDFKEQAAQFGEDPYPLGIRANRKMLETLFKASFDQGLTKKAAQIEDIFYPTTLDT